MFSRFTPFLSFLVVMSCSLCAMDNYHFYRAPFFFGEPRLLEPKLVSFDCIFGAGSTTKSYNQSCQEKTSLLNLYGPQNILKLGSNIPCKNRRRIEDLVLIMLDRMVGNDCFGYLRFLGRFTLAEMHLMATINARHGLFAQIDVPLRFMSLRKIYCQDLSELGCQCPNGQNVIWKTFLKIQDQIYNRYGINAGGFSKQGAGDISIMFGWGYNYQELRVLDFIDITGKIGMLLPSGKKQNIDYAFDLPLGYNGHWGVGGSGDFAVGIYDWLTLGGHVNAIAFLDHTDVFRMKTDARQNGFIKLAKGCATSELGPIWNAGAFIKADHVAGGLSLLAGYSYTQKQRDMLHPQKTSCFNPTAVCCDSMLSGWKMQTVHLLMEYDGAREGRRVSPRVALLANIIVDGEHIFATNMYGGSIGIDISYQF